MAAKNKRANRGAAADAVTSDVPARSAGTQTTRDLLFRASHHREELLEEARTLMTAGRVREARAVEKRAGQVDQLVGALESDIRSSATDRH